MIRAALAAGESLRLSKFVAYHWAPEASDADVLGRVERTLDRGDLERLRGGRSRAPCGGRRVLVAQRRRARGRSRAPAGGALQPVLADAGDRARRGSRRAGEGRDRARLRGPLLLGHRDLPRAVPVPHHAALGQAGAGVPLRDARRGADARGADRSRRRRVPVADDRRIRGVGVVCRRDRAAPHQRRRRLRDAPVQPGHRRPRLHARPGRRSARRDGALLDRAGLSLRAPRRAVLHQRRDRARRVHDRRGQQRLHQPDGQGEPGDRGPRDRVAPGSRPRGARRARCGHRPDRPRGRGLAPRRRDDARPTRRAAGHRAAGRALPRAQALGLRRARRPTSTRCCCTITRSSSTATR